MAAMRVAALTLAAASGVCMVIAILDRDLFEVTTFGFVWLTNVIVTLELLREPR